MDKTIRYWVYLKILGISIYDCSLASGFDKIWI